MRAAGANHMEVSGGKADPGLARHPRLGAGDQSFDVPESGIEVLALVQAITVEPGELVLPECLPLGKDQLFQLAVRSDEQKRGPSLEADPSLDAEGRFADVDVAANGVGIRDLAQLLNQSGAGQG